LQLATLFEWIGAMLLDITGKLVINIRAREWCRLPYPGHPAGCPNYGISEQCPPKVPIVSKVFDLSKPHWFAVERFDLSAHSARMAAEHPGWSERQCRCCLYWQNGVRKGLRQKCEAFVAGRPGITFTLIPEAMGVNVFLTARKMDVRINRLAFPVVHKVALVGMVAQNTIEVSPTAINNACMPCSGAAM
jgi:hypothetical protein